MAKKTQELAPVAVEPAPVEPPVAEPAVESTAPQKRSGLVLAAWIVGAVLVGGALFGGGVALGANLPGSSQGQFERPDFRGGDGFPGGGNGPVMPGEGAPDDTQGTAPDTDSN